MDKNSHIIHGDIIKTEKEQMLILKSDASTYKISQNSFIKLDLSESDIIQSEIAWGTSVINFTRDAIKNKKIEALKIKTKSASLAVRGTTLFAHVEKNGELTTSVNHGHVESSQEGNEIIDIRDGQSIMLSAKKGGESATALGFEKHINWNLDSNSEDLSHPEALFSSIRQKWEDYKKENEMKWDAYKRDMDNKWK